MPLWVVVRIIRLKSLLFQKPRQMPLQRGKVRSLKKKPGKLVNFPSLHPNEQWITKSDITSFGSDFKEGVRQLQAQILYLRNELSRDIESIGLKLGENMKSLKMHITRWLIVNMVCCAGFILLTTIL